MSRFVRPATSVLTLANGDTLVVKQQLNTGETHRLYEMMYRELTNGERQFDPIKSRISLVLAYLLDWSLVDDEGRPVVIREQSPDVVQAALENLFPEDFSEIHTVIKAHEQRMAEIRAEEKKTQTGETASPRI